ncbi:MAG TPA: rhodanese-like domain-containing protein [Solirubrobacterales bacterium]|nr:rhodanese-like domain-containing protein [Solirubrobacterales bacterium]
MSDPHGLHPTIEELLAEAQAAIRRFGPADARAAVAAGAVLVDIRPVEQRERDGLVPGAAIVDRNVLEWRLDPASPWRVPHLARRDVPVILICNEGYQSSLAAHTLRRLGLDAGDVVGGVQAWREDGLPLARGGDPQAESPGGTSMSARPKRGPRAGRVGSQSGSTER